MGLKIIFLVKLERVFKVSIVLSISLKNIAGNGGFRWGNSSYAWHTVVIPSGCGMFVYVRFVTSTETSMAV